MADMTHKDWQDEVESEKEAHQKFRDESIEVRKVYRLQDNPDATRYNIFWANVDVLHGALFSNSPKVDIRRRFKDDNPVSRNASDVLGRALEFNLDMYPFDTVMDLVVDDYLICALGQIKVVYEPYMQETVPDRLPLTKSVDPSTGADQYMGMDGQPHDPAQDGEVHHDGDETYTLGKSGEEIAFQAVSCECVPWDRFLWAPSKDWKGTWWVGEEHYLTRDEIADMFVISAVDLDRLSYGYAQDGRKREGEKADKHTSRALVIEIWDQRHRKHFGYIESYDKLLKFKLPDGTAAEDDPLGLKNFYPYPMPLFANVISGDLVPKTDYSYYQDQAQELDELSVRIERLTRELKWRGIYDANFIQLLNVTQGADGTFEGVENYAQRFGKDNEISSVIATMPLEVLMEVVGKLIELRDVIKQTVYEITGIADIVRGSTSPSETLGAQQLKGQFANMRLGRRQRRVQFFVRDVFRIMAEIIAEHFEPDVLHLMTGIEVDDQVLTVLRSDALREFNVDVESDSTVLADEQVEQENRTKILTAVTELMTQLGPILAPMGQQGMDMLKTLVLFALSGFKESRTIEELFEHFEMPAPQQPTPPEPPPPPDPNQAALLQHKVNGQQLDNQLKQGKLSEQQMLLEQIRRAGGPPQDVQ